MDKTLKLSLIIGIIITSFSIAFYFVYFLPNKDRSKTNIKKECFVKATESKELAIIADNSAMMDFDMPITRSDYDAVFNNKYDDCIKASGY